MDLLFDTPETDKRKEQIYCWAKRYIDVAHGSKKFTLEKELLELKKSKPEYLEKNELELLVRWKSPRNLTYISKNNNEITIVEKTQEAFKTTNVCDSIKILSDLKGVGYSIGSAILHLFHPENNYPIYDPHALRAVAKRPKDNVWESYVEFCRKLAEDNEVCMRTLDRALYRFGYVLSVMEKIEGDLECLGVDALTAGDEICCRSRVKRC